MTCDHSSIGADPRVVEFFKCCHRYRKGDKFLTSVSKVIREVWPDKPSWEGVDMAVVENARDRGVECDMLFSGWINGTLREIPANTRIDAVDRFKALCDWWVARPAMAQEILADDEVAGTADLIIVGGGAEIWDLKNTSKIESTYSLQIGAYCELYQRMYGELPKRAGVIHVTQPKDEPVKIRTVPYEVDTIVSEWRLLREFWVMTQRKRR